MRYDGGKVGEEADVEKGGRGKRGGRGGGELKIPRRAQQRACHWLCSETSSCFLPSSTTTPHVFSHSHLLICSQG
eukprot:768439-Hanusia_phi.AAC.1